MAFLRDMRFMREVTALPAMADTLRESVVRGVFLREERAIPKDVVRVLTAAPHLTATVDNELEIRKIIRILNGEEGTQAFGPLVPGMPVSPEDMHYFRRMLGVQWESRAGVGGKASLWTTTERLVPLQGGVQIDLSKLRTVEIDGVTYTAQVQSGATWKEAYERARAKGMWLSLYPVVPLDFAFGDTLYGDARLVSFRGDFDDAVNSVRVVNAEGVQVTHGFTRVPNHATAYDLRYLATMLGGDVGVVTAISVRLEARPKVVKNLAYGFADAAAMGVALEKLLSSGRRCLWINAFDDRAWAMLHPGNPAGPFVLEVGLGGRESLVAIREKAVDALMAGNQAKAEVPSHLDAPIEAYRKTAVSVGKKLFPGELLSSPRHVPKLAVAVKEMAGSRGLRGGFFAAATAQHQVSLFPFFEAPKELPRVYDLSRALWDLAKPLGGEVQLVSPLAHFWSGDKDLARRVEILEKADAVLDQPNVLEPPAILTKPKMFFAPE